MLKKVILGLLILRGLTGIQAQCLEGDCRNGYGTAVFKKSDGVKYVGYFKDKRPNGRGTADYPNGRRYEGDWLDGVWSGQGVLTLTDGSSLTGAWLNGKFQSRIKYAKSSLPSTQNPSQDVVQTENTTRPSEVFEDPQSRSRRQDIAPPLLSREKEAPQAIWGLAVGVADYDNPTIPH